mgnify:CR=1 FL=1
MDLRPYHIEGFKAYEYPGAYLFEGVPYNLPNNLKTQFHDLGRAAVLQASHPYAAYRQDIPLTWSGLPATNDNINGFDYQHHMADDLYEYYLLTGEPLALSALEHMGQALLTYKSVKGPIGGTSPTDDDLAAARAAAATGPHLRKELLALVGRHLLRSFHHLATAFGARRPILAGAEPSESSTRRTTFAAGASSRAGSFPQAAAANTTRTASSTWTRFSQPSAGALIGSPASRASRRAQHPPFVCF